MNAKLKACCLLPMEIGSDGSILLAFLLHSLPWEKSLFIIDDN